MRGNNKSYMVRKALPYGVRNSRLTYLEKIEKHATVLIYSLVLFTFACLTIIVTFAFQLFV